MVSPDGEPVRYGTVEFHSTTELITAGPADELTGALEQVVEVPDQGADRGAISIEVTTSPFIKEEAAIPSMTLGRSGRRSAIGSRCSVATR